MTAPERASAPVRIMYKPWGVIAGVAGGMVAGAVFKQIWRLMRGGGWACRHLCVRSVRTALTREIHRRGRKKMLRLAAELLASVGCVFGLGDMARCRAPARRSRHGQGARAAGEDGRKGSGRP